jgi:hypothetical protein
MAGISEYGDQPYQNWIDAIGALGYARVKEVDGMMMTG